MKPRRRTLRHAIVSPRKRAAPRSVSQYLTGPFRPWLAILIREGKCLRSFSNLALSFDFLPPSPPIGQIYSKFSVHGEMFDIEPTPLLSPTSKTLFNHFVQSRERQERNLDFSSILKSIISRDDKRENAATFDSADAWKCLEVTCAPRFR